MRGAVNVLLFQFVHSKYFIPDHRGSDFQTGFTAKHFTVVYWFTECLVTVKEGHGPDSQSNLHDERLIMGSPGVDVERRIFV
jgi:hypothetical protein